VHLSLISWPHLNSQASERLAVALLQLRGIFRPFAAEKSSSLEDSQLSASIIRIAIPLPCRLAAVQHLEPVQRIFLVPLSDPEYTREIHLHQCDSVIILPLSALIPPEFSLPPLSAKEPLLGLFNIGGRAVSPLVVFLRSVSFSV